MCTKSNLLDTSFHILTIRPRQYVSLPHKQSAFLFSGAERLAPRIHPSPDCIAAAATLNNDPSSITIAITFKAWTIRTQRTWYRSIILHRLIQPCLTCSPAASIAALGGGVAVSRSRHFPPAFNMHGPQHFSGGALINVCRRLIIPPVACKDHIRYQISDRYPYFTNFTLFVASARLCHTGGVCCTAEPNLRIPGARAGMGSICSFGLR